MNNYYQDENTEIIKKTKDKRFELIKKVITCEKDFFKNEKTVLELQTKLKKLVKNDNLKTIDNIEIENTKESLNLTYYILLDKKNPHLQGFENLNGEKLKTLNTFFEYYEKCENDVFKETLIEILNKVKENQPYKALLKENIDIVEHKDNEIVYRNLASLETVLEMYFPYNDFDQDELNDYQRIHLILLCKIYKILTKKEISISSVFKYFKVN